jgi:hypothetical protein
MRTSQLITTLLLAPLAVSLAGVSPADPDCLTVVNCADKPVYAAAISIPDTVLYGGLKLPEGTPLKATTAGQPVTLLPGAENGVKVVRAYLSLKPGERMDLKLEAAPKWEDVSQISSAAFDSAEGTAKLGNGVLAFEYRGNQWALAYEGPQAERIVNIAKRQLLTGSRLEGWLDSERRGRLMGIAAEKVKAMGLISLSEARLVSGEAKVDPDGSATLKLVKGFGGGLAGNITWTEIYTLLPGQPILTYRAIFGTLGDKTRFLAYVEHGTAMAGDYGNLLKGKLRFKYQDPREPKRILLSGSENSFTRLGWRGERCWVGVDSELGNGIGFLTTKEVTRSLPGDSIWSFSNSGFFIRFIDPEQEQFPYEFTKECPLDLGFAFVASCGDAGVWNQTRRTYAAITREQVPRLNSSCAVFLAGQPLQAGTVSLYQEAFGAAAKMIGSETKRCAALELDFQRGYRLTAKAASASVVKPITIGVRPLGSAQALLNVLTLDQPGEKDVDFTALTQWIGKRQAFILEVQQPDGTRLESVRLEPVGLASPELIFPSDGLKMTDLATFFKWRQVKGALDYELQMSRNVQFIAPVSFKVRSEIDVPYFMPEDKELPGVGPWFWRIRAVEPDSAGAWSATRRFEVNDVHAKRPVSLVISPEHPLITIEGNAVADLSLFTNTIPADLKPYVAFNCNNSLTPIPFFKPLQAAGQMTFMRTHGPGPMSYWMSLAAVEEVFQTYTNVIGIMGGETLSAHYHGGANQVYMNRLLKLCGKYGRIFYDADGTYPGENKWEALYAKQGALMNEYADHLIFAQKNNILHRQFVSQSSVLGLYLAGGIIAQGAWEDGGWYWQQTGFRKLGEIRGQRGGEACDMPRNFWNLNFLMGISRGCSVFSFEGQTGTMPVRAGWKLAKDGFPKTYNPMAHWTNKGELTPAFHRFMAPFLRGLISHQLIPTKEQVREQIRLAVYNDGVPKKENGDPYYYEWEALYRGTYGFRDVGVIPGTLMEFFPNTGRYYYIPVFPQGKVDLGRNIQTLPLSQLGDPAKVKARFDQAYPSVYEGDALVTLVGDTLAVLNSHENQDVAESYNLPLKGRGFFRSITGTIAPHSYLIGKFEEGNTRLWLQANAEYQERDTEVTVVCNGQPKVTVTPASAAKVNTWDAAVKKLTLRLSHAEGAVEVGIVEQ